RSSGDVGNTARRKRDDELYGLVRVGVLSGTCDRPQGRQQAEQDHPCHLATPLGRCPRQRWAVNEQRENKVSLRNLPFLAFTANAPSAGARSELLQLLEQLFAFRNGPRIVYL